MFGRKKKNAIHLSDELPLTPLGALGLTLSYIILIFWALLIIVPLGLMIITAFNGSQGTRLSMNFAGYKLSLDNFTYLFEKTDFLIWTRNTLVIASVTAILVVVIVSFTGYAYSRFRFKGRKASLTLYTT